MFPVKQRLTIEMYSLRKDSEGEGGGVVGGQREKERGGWKNS